MGNFGSPDADDVSNADVFSAAGSFQGEKFVGMSAERFVAQVSILDALHNSLTDGRRLVFVDKVHGF